MIVRVLLGRVQCLRKKGSKVKISDAKQGNPSMMMAVILLSIRNVLPIGTVDFGYISNILYYAIELAPRITFYTAYK